MKVAETTLNEGDTNLSKQYESKACTLRTAAQIITGGNRSAAWCGLRTNQIEPQPLEADTELARVGRHAE